MARIEVLQSVSQFFRWGPILLAACTLLMRVAVF